MNNDIIRKGAILISKLRKGNIRWKPGKGHSHLDKRIRLKHIPSHYTLDEYNELIICIANTNANELYLYYRDHFGQKYFSIGSIKERWEVIIGEDGIMETAYKITHESYTNHFNEEGYLYLGTLKEVLAYGDEKENQ